MVIYNTYISETGTHVVYEDNGQLYDYCYETGETILYE